jgi:hypothetical protein
MDWILRRLLGFNHPPKVQRTQRLIEWRREMLHQRHAVHNWENEGGNVTWII